MPFLSPNEQHQSTEGITEGIKMNKAIRCYMQKNIQADIIQNLQKIQVLAAGEQHSELVWSSTRQWHLATIHKVSSFLMAHQYIIG